MSTRKDKNKTEDKKGKPFSSRKRTEREDFKNFNENDLPSDDDFVNWVADGMDSGVRKQLFQHVAPAGSRSCASTTQRTLPALSVEIKWHLATELFFWGNFMRWKISSPTALPMPESCMPVKRTSGGAWKRDSEEMEGHFRTSDGFAGRALSQEGEEA